MTGSTSSRNYLQTGSDVPVTFEGTSSYTVAEAGDIFSAAVTEQTVYTCPTGKIAVIDVLMAAGAVSNASYVGITSDMVRVLTIQSSDSYITKTVRLNLPAPGTVKVTVGASSIITVLLSIRLYDA